jgi:hypothetical protein
MGDLHQTLGLAPDLPATYIRLVSPNQPSKMTVTSMFRMSPAFSTLSPGMPWQTTWFTEMQLACS